MSKISIALCTYNGAKFLSDQLESYVRQTRLPDELVVCDDCSQDETVEIIREFSQKSSFPVHLHVNEKNLCSTRNFEKAISLCSGDLIFLSDQDDYWMPEKLEKIEAEFAKDTQIGMVFSDAEIVDENLRSANCRLWDFTFIEERREATRKGKFFDVLLSQNVVTGATMAFRAECRDIFMPIPENIPNLIHDGWIALLITNEKKIAFIDEPLIKYRQHSSQQLGIDYHTALKLDYLQRKQKFAVSIKVNQQEQTRLNLLEKIFNEHPQFAARRETVSFDDLRSEKRAKAAHYEARMNLPQSRIKRFFPICREISTGRYHRFSKNLFSAAKDFFEKW